VNPGGLATRGTSRARRTRRGSRGRYLVPVPLGLEVEPLGDEVVPEDEPPGVVDGLVDGDVVDEGGDAEGVRSPPGRSPTRSEPVSLQAVSSPALSARAQKPVSNLFISGPPLVGLREPFPRTATDVPGGCLDTARYNHYQCG
jgi:hypothetical protein